MNRIICDICGTTYPESSECCPICGSSREFGVENPDYLPASMPEYVPRMKKKTGLFSAAMKKTQEGLYDPEDMEPDVPMDILPETDFPERVTHDTQGRRPETNYFLVALLTVLIGLCVLMSGFLLFRFYLPHQFPRETEPELQETVADTEPVEDSSEAVIPCTSIVLTAGVPEINRIGQYWLLHVIVLPENTTDQLSFASMDESIVTVTGEGRLCAVGEGQTTVVISCGSEKILCQVTVKLPEETWEDSLDESDEGAPLSENANDTVEETQLLPSGSGDTERSEQVILKLKQTDISFTKKGVTFELELDCDLDPKDVAWMTLDPDVAICHDGVITVLGNGTTRIVAQYGDQQVYCIVRCNFK